MTEDVTYEILLSQGYETGSDVHKSYTWHNPALLSIELLPTTASFLFVFNKFQSIMA